MAVADDVLAPYVAAETIEDAEHALDALVQADVALPVPAGELYDELAEAAADDGEYAAAARLQRKALDTGCRHPFVAREMLGWYLLKAGAVDEGEAVFEQLRRERPDDCHVLITLGHARSDASMQSPALEAFDEAVAVAQRRGFQQDLDRARIERRAEREHVGLDADRDDRLAPAPRPLVTQAPMRWSLAWFPPDQRAGALERWPDLAEDFEDGRAYSRRLEAHLRDLARALGRDPTVAPIDVDALVQWATEAGYDPASGEARSAYAAELARTGAALHWPPGRNDPCWCRSGRKYKRCCGSR